MSYSGLATGRPPSPDDQEKRDRDGRRNILTQAYEWFNTVDAEPDVPAEFNTGRKRLDWMINHRNLAPEDIVDRGRPADRRYARFALRRELDDLVKWTINGTQSVLDVLGPAAVEDDTVTNPHWVFDEKGVLVDNLHSANSL
ncbi:uncharacterized protein SCHCODRAFT_02501820, partial [Schizophyllum commune H4-8]|uniref:uncharacterized protein n=1 Tax=Schizophyllum commune (strain H4-8 / FGSC 9210) TaxID=578458 RepID=UPI00215DD9A8